MHSVRRCLCQTACLLLAGGTLARGETLPPPSPSPAPPPWQAEVDAARSLQASLFLVPARDENEERTRRQRMVQMYQRLAAKYPAAAPVQQAAGDGLAGLDQKEAALRCWLDAQRLDPPNAEVAESLGSAYLAAGRVREAAAQFQRAADVRPDSSAYHFALGNVQYLFRHQLLNPPALPDDQAVLRLALEHLRRAAELAPDDLRLAKAYAETFYIFPQPDWAQALAAWQKVLALSGEDRDFAHAHLARVSLRLGHREDAEAYLAKIHDPAYDGLKRKLLQTARKEGGDRPPLSPAPPG